MTILSRYSNWSCALATWPRGGHWAFLFFFYWLGCVALRKLFKLKGCYLLQWHHWLLKKNTLQIWANQQQVTLYKLNLPKRKSVEISKEWKVPRGEVLTLPTSCDLLLQLNTVFFALHFTLMLWGEFLNIPVRLVHMDASLSNSHHPLLLPPLI